MGRFHFERTSDRSIVKQAKLSIKIKKTSNLLSFAKSLKKVLLVTTGRTGSDFFQSLLDGHKEILQFPGHWNFFGFWDEAVCKENLSDLIDEFIWHTKHEIHIARFKSEYNKLERWDQLGDLHNEKFQVSISKFKSSMIAILKESELNAENFFLAVHLAYAEACGQQTTNAKLIFYHIHHIEKLERFVKNFPDFDVICTIRDPRNTISAGIISWKNYEIDAYNPWFYYNLVHRVFLETELIKKYSSKFKTLRLETLHLFPKETMLEFCDDYSLTYNTSMLVSSYLGKKWWGDSLSKKYLDGFNPKISERKWETMLFGFENPMLEFLLFDRLKYYKYELISKSSKYKLNFFLFIPLLLLPTKIELQILIFRIKNSNSIKSFLITTMEFALFYLKRQFLFFRFLSYRIRNHLFLPNSFLLKH